MPRVPRFDILGFGAVAVDDLLYVDHYPSAESKVRVRQRRRQCGGLTGTALVAAARLGTRCAYVGMLGDDELSRFAIDALGREGVDLAHHVPRADARPAHSTIVVDRTKHTRTIFSSVEGPLGADPMLPEEALIRAARVLLVDHHGVEGTLRAVRIARESGVAVVADVERDPGGSFGELLARIDHLVISQHFAQELTDAVEPAEAARRLGNAERQAVVVTCGEAGCWYVDPALSRNPCHFPAMAVEVVDTTGCGDVFHGAYAAALAAGEPLRQRLTLATAAAALKATRRGGQAGCPSRREVDEFLKERDFKG